VRLVTSVGALVVLLLVACGTSPSPSVPSSVPSTAPTTQAISDPALLYALSRVRMSHIKGFHVELSSNDPDLNTAGSKTNDPAFDLVPAKATAVIYSPARSISRGNNCPIDSCLVLVAEYNDSSAAHHLVSIYVDGSCGLWLRKDDSYGPEAGPVFFAQYTFSRFVDVDGREIIPGQCDGSWKRR
jgi:hypothetical protein